MAKEKNSAVHKFFSRMWAVPVVGAFTIVAHYVGVLAPLEHLSALVVLPFQAQAYEATIEPLSRDALSNMDHAELVDDYLALQDALQNAKVENAHLRTLTEEVELLDEQVQFLEKRSFEARTAKVVTRSSDGLSRSIVLNRGAADGVAVGYPVISGDGILVGTVHSVDDVTSIVQLTTSYDAIIAGSLQNKDRSPGILRGSHNLGLEMEYIPQGHKVAVGDMVITNGSDPLIPRGLILGEVEQTNAISGSVFQSAQVRPLYEAEDTFIVSIILP